MLSADRRPELRRRLAVSELEAQRIHRQRRQAVRQAAPLHRHRLLDKVAQQPRHVLVPSTGTDADAASGLCARDVSVVLVAEENAEFAKRVVSEILDELQYGTDHKENWEAYGGILLQGLALLLR